ncbi:MAG: hypothetical protein QM820_56485 [Minicystis sp.]
MESRIRNLLFLACAAAHVLAAAGCGGGGETSATTSSTSSSSSSGGGEGGAAPMADRGPTTIALDGDPDGLFWDEATRTLFIADNDNNRILQYRDGEGISLYAELGMAPASGPGLGQLVKLADGTIVVPRFGFGMDGDVAVIKPDKSTSTVPGLDPIRRRIGLTITKDGVLYDSYFAQTPSGKVGAVAKLDLAGTEEEVLTGVDKPVGVLADGDFLVVSAQYGNQIVRAPIAHPDQLTVIAQIDAPDLLCPGPNGSYFTGGKGGSVRQVFGDGKFSDFAGGFQEIRGVAYDAKNGRLFAADHDPGGMTHKLQIVPVD